MHSKSVLESLESRRSVRRYSSRAVDPQLVFRLLEACNRTASGYNVQPWHFILVENPEIKQLLQKVSFGQRQVLEAPLTVVFVSDTECWKKPFTRVLQLAAEHKALPQAQVEKQRKIVTGYFDLGLFGLRGLFRRFSHLFHQLGRPVVTPCTSHAEVEHYMRSQTMLAVSSFLLAAESVGLATCPMEGFDENRLKRLLAIPRTMSVPAMVTLGYPLEGTQNAKSVRIPLEEKLHFDLFTTKSRAAGKK